MNGISAESVLSVETSLTTKLTSKAKWSLMIKQESLSLAPIAVTEILESFTLLEE